MHVVIRTRRRDQVAIPWPKSGEDFVDCVKAEKASYLIKYRTSHKALIETDGEDQSLHAVRYSLCVCFY